MHYHPFPLLKLLALANSLDEFVLLESGKVDPENHTSYFFYNPVKQFTLLPNGGLEKTISEIEQSSSDYYTAGYLTYELGRYLINHSYPATQILGVFTAYKNYILFDHRTGTFKGNGFIPDDLSFKPVEYKINNLRMDVSEEDYKEKVKRIKKYIYEGDTYQVNLTMRYFFDFAGCPLSLYIQLANSQPVPYQAIIKIGGLYILSFSPELFFSRDGESIYVQPMKGTAHRGSTNQEDAAQKMFLQTDPKNKAENTMIVDLMRNDLGRICKIGSVVVRHAFTVEKYRTLFQMTSGIEGQLKEDISFFSLLDAVFPSGSVTGAPKIRTMQIIEELETGQRHVYTGGIGFIGPNSTWKMNVPIRTLIIENGKGVFGVGSGITYESDSEEEFKECLLKARFLTNPIPEFSLIETMLWNNGIVFLNDHLDRLEDSAKYFDYPCSRQKVIEAIENLELQPGKPYKIRLLLNKDGIITITYEIFEPEPGSNIISLYPERTNSSDAFLYHKTTNRFLYNQAAIEAKQKGLADYIFLNERGEVTEGATTNIVVRKGDQWLTPYINCGLLNGIYRRYFLRKNPAIREASIGIDDLRSADEIMLTNALRGEIKVLFIE